MNRSFRKRPVLWMAAWPIACWFAGVGFLVFSIGPVPGASAAEPSFTRLAPLQNPKIVGCAPAYPGGNYEADNVLDGAVDGPHCEYAAAGDGPTTFIDFDFGRPTRVAGFKHVDRNDIATVEAAELIFGDSADFSRPIATVAVEHANRRSGTTMATFPAVTARYVRWNVTEHTMGTSGGAEIAFFTNAAPEPSPVATSIQSVQGLPVLLKQGGRRTQPLRVAIEYPYVEPVDAMLQIAGMEPIPVRLQTGLRTVEVSLPAVTVDTDLDVAVAVDGRPVVKTKQTVKPVRQFTVYFLPHSHVDIGYTHVQTDVMLRQWGHFEKAIELARRTADYPPEARFQWSVEVLWAVDSYLKEAPPEKRKAFLDAVERGWIHLDGLYGNQLTALCRPEELFQLLDCSRRLSRQYGLSIETAMISDVPGYTWGIVPVLAQNGIKYFSIGPNHCHRIGRTLEAWADRPFYWVSPSGRERVLCWIPAEGYSWYHRIQLADSEKLLGYLDGLADSDYPYDMVQMRYTVGGDNGPPDENLPEFVKEWNAKYEWPKLAITTTGRLFRQFEERYGDSLPEVRGDFTPYWEDGAGSSARETALARMAAERLAQAGALWAMLAPDRYPDDEFYAAWRNVLLYNEHTWGAHCSISKPDDPFTLSQWKIKQAFALDADAQSHELLARAVAARRSPAKPLAAVDVYNTCSWPRTDLVLLPASMKLAGESVTDAAGRSVRSQRLAGGELAVLACDVPPFGAKRLSFAPGESAATGNAHAQGARLSNGRLQVTVDAATGAIASLTAADVPGELVDRAGGAGINDYFYVPSRNPKDATRGGTVKIAVEDAGPLVASLRVEADDVPGCRKLTRHVRLVDGLDRVDLTNVVDKAPVRTKESVHFGFALNVPEGLMRCDVPWAVVRPETDQLPGACKNYLTVGRWVDVSNASIGVTWATLDAPLVELGRIRVDVAEPFGPEHWVDRLEPTQTFFSYVMNNYWETNYKADQEGPTTFRYSLAPHGPFDQAAASRFGIERSRPLLPVPADPGTNPLASPIRVTGAGVVVESLKPSHAEQALIVRLFNTTDRPTKATIEPGTGSGRTVVLSDPFEAKGPPVTGPIDLPPYGIVTLRIGE